MLLTALSRSVRLTVGPTVDVPDGNRTDWMKMPWVSVLRTVLLLTASLTSAAPSRS